MELQNYGFHLDAGKVELHSADPHKIMLPYIGPLPEGVNYTGTPRVHFIVQATQRERVTLTGETEDRRNQRIPIRASREEIKAILGRFLFDEEGNGRLDCGLSPYWMGVWTAFYLEWLRLPSSGLQRRWTF